MNDGLGKNSTIGVRPLLYYFAIFAYKRGLTPIVLFLRSYAESWR